MANPVKADQWGDWTYTVDGSNVTITGYTGTGGVVTIPVTIIDQPVINIGVGAFSNCVNLIGIYIPIGIASIEDSAFQDCTNLTIATISPSISRIGKNAFSACTSLNDIRLNTDYFTIADIGESAFSQCRSLTRVRFTNGSINIGDSAFMDCTSLSSVSIGYSVKSIGNLAFAQCTNLMDINFCDSPPFIGSSVFTGDVHAIIYYYPLASGRWDTTFCGIQTMLLPFTYTYTTNGVSITGYTGTNGIAIMPGFIEGFYVGNIEDFAFFESTTLTNLFIASGITSIGNYAFEDCTGLTSVSIPGSVTNIGAAAFGGTGLTNVMISSNVMKMGYGAFSYCPNLSSIKVDPSNSVYSSNDGVLFNKNQTTIIQCPGGRSGYYLIPDSVTNIGVYAFYYCEHLTGVAIPFGITNILYETFFHCSSLTNVAFPNSLASIDGYSFERCNNLVNIMIPANVANIGYGAFNNCANLSTMYFQGNAPLISSDAFDGDTNLTVYYNPWTSGWTNTLGGRPTQINPSYTQWLLNNNFSTNSLESTTNDYDHDGMLNWQEYLAGTNPTNASDKLAISFMGTESNLSQISWQAKSNVSYQVMKSLDLMGAWSNAPTETGTNQQAFQTAPADGLLQYTDPDYTGATNGFYRVNVVP